MKKIVAMLLVACALTTSMFAAKKKVETLKISVFTIQSRKQPSKSNKTYKWIKENFGVEFTWDILVGDKDQKIGMLIASGDLPDLVEVDSEKFQGAGCLRDLLPLLQKANCQNLLKHYGSVWQKMLDVDSEKDANGKIVKEHIYSLPNYGVIDGKSSGTYYNQNAWWIQNCVLQEFGYPTISTIDEYFDLLEKYYKKYPTIDGMPTIPFSILTYDWEAFNLWNPPNFLSGNPNDGNGHVELVNGKYVYKDNFQSDAAKRWFKLANGYYKRGLIDPASFTDNKDQYWAKVTQGRVLGFFIQGWEFMGTYDSALEVDGKGERTYCPLPVTFDNTVVPRYVDSDLPNLQRGYGITTKCSEEKAIKILKFMDEMLKEENQKVLYWGFEGEDYLIDKDGSVTGVKGQPYRTEKMRKEQKDPKWVEKNRARLWDDEAPKIEGTTASGYNRSIEEYPYEQAAANADHPWDVELWKAYGVGSYKELMSKPQTSTMNTGWYPLWQLNPNAENGGAEATAKEAQVQFEDTWARKYLPKMIMCETDAEFEKLWAEYVAGIKPYMVTWNAYFQNCLDDRISKYGAVPEGY